MLKRFLSVLTVLCLAISFSTTSVSAHQDNPSELPEHVSEMSDKELKQYYGKLNKHEDYREVRKWLESEGLSINRDSFAGLKFEEWEHPIENTTHSEVLMISFYAEETNNDQLGLVSLALDTNNDEIIYLSGQSYYDIVEEGNGEASYSKVQSYINGIGFSEFMTEGEYDEYMDDIHNNSQGEVTTADACGYGSVAACSYHCAIWALGTGGVGGVICSLACGSFSHWACSNF